MMSALPRMTRRAARAPPPSSASSTPLPWTDGGRSHGSGENGFFEPCASLERVQRRKELYSLVPSTRLLECFGCYRLLGPAVLVKVERVGGVGWGGVGWFTLNSTPLNEP